MDPEQTRIIEKKLPILAKSIKCSLKFLQTLQANSIIFDDDAEFIFNLDGSQLKTTKLLDILKTRTGGFSGLLMALKETNQIEALTILEAEKTSQSTGKDDISWEFNPKTLEVGSKDCRITEIVNAIEEHPVGNRLVEKYSEFARRLNISSIQRDEFYRSIMHSKKSQVEIIEKILEAWSADESEKATLEVLFNVLNKCGCGALVEGITKELKKKKTAKAKLLTEMDLEAI